MLKCQSTKFSTILVYLLLFILSEIFIYYQLNNPKNGLSVLLIILRKIAPIILIPILLLITPHTQILIFKKIFIKSKYYRLIF